MTSESKVVVMRIPVDVERVDVVSDQRTKLGATVLSELKIHLVPLILLVVTAVLTASFLS